MRAAAAFGSSLLLAACAAPPSGVPSELGAPGGASGAGCGPLFISPAGEPFRRAPEEPGCPVERWFAGADADRDGALSPAEFRADALRFFAALDIDGDGSLGAVELQRYEREVAPEILGRPGGDGPRAAAEQRPRLVLVALDMQGPGGMGGIGGMGPGTGGRRGPPGDPRHRRPGGSGPAGGGGAEGAARFGLLAEPEPVAAADLDLNGRITRAEFAARADQRFRTLDAAEAGRLTLAGLQERMRGANPPRRREGGGRPPGGWRRGVYGGVDAGVRG